MGGGKLEYIDTVRGIAILLVVLVHQAGAVATTLPLSVVGHQIGEYGHMGVQMFFVASAITLGRSFEHRRSEDRAVLKFYLRRLFRIAPMYWLAICLYFAVAVVVTGETSPFTLPNVAANALFVHGFVPGAINDVVPGGWSIAGEMFFYSWFPVAFVAWAWINARWGVTPLLALTSLVFAVYAAAWHIIPLFSVYEITRGNIFYYWAPAQVPVFLIGLTGYFCWRRWPPHRAATNLVMFSLLTGLTVAMWRSGYVAAFAWVPSIAALSFLFLLRGLSCISRLPTWLQAVGKVSYSMYILHFLVVWFGAPVVVNWLAQHVPHGDTVLVISYPLTAIVAFGLAWLSTHSIEAWGIRTGRDLIASIGQKRGPLTVA